MSQMYADDNYKNSFIKNDLIYVMFLGTRQMSGFVSFLNKGSMYWPHLFMDTTMGRAYEIICYSEIPSLQITLVSIGKGTECLLFSF